jgi:hypothetical protein
MSGLFSNSNVMEAFDKSFSEKDEGIVSGTGETTLAEEGASFYDANQKARSIALKGSKPEDLELELDDPRYDAMNALYQRQLDTYNKQNRLGQYATDSSEIERMQASGVPETELSILRSKPEAPPEVLEKARQMSMDPDGPDANQFLTEQGFRTLAPQAPVQRKTRRQLREELGLSSRDIDRPRRLTEDQFEDVQEQMIRDTIAPQAPREVIEEAKKYQNPNAYVRSQGYGTRNMQLGRMADPKYREAMGLKPFPVDVPRNRGVLEKTFNALDKGVTRLNSVAVAGRWLVAQHYW